jgi:hypothetical protein
MSIQICRHVLHVVDAAAELATLAKIVDADEKSLSSASAVGVLESIAGGGAMSKVLRLRRRRRWSPIAS